VAPNSRYLVFKRIESESEKMNEKIKKFVKALMPIKPENLELFSPLALPLKILKINGNWLTKDSSWQYWVYCVVLHLSVMELGTALQLLYLPHVNDFFDLTQLVTMLPSCISVSIQTMVVYYYKNEIFAIMDMIRECVDEHGMSTTLKKHLLYIDKYMRAFLLLTLFNISSFTIFGFAGRELFFKMWFPFEVDFWIALFYQICCLYNYSLVNLVMDIFPVFYMVYIVGMLEQLCEKFENIKKHRVLNEDGTVNKMKQVDNRKELIACIEYHLKILAINKKVQKVFSPFFLVRGFLSVAVLCTTILALIVLSDPAIFGKLSAYVIIMFVSIFVPCYYGSQIKAISSQISTRLFHSEWLLEDKEYRQLVKIAMGFAERNMKITVAGIFDVDLENFKLICESVYSMYCICKHFMQID
jgi:hypothetical protein